MDKSFQGLLLSIFLHIFLILVLWNAKAPNFDALSDRTEVVLIEKAAHQKKSKAFVTETEKDKTPDSISDEADMLSMFTKRVKKQMRAMRTGPTVNAAPRPQQAVQQPQKSNKVAGMRNQETDEGFGPQAGGPQQPAIRNMAIGQSSIAEYIPGVEEGSFTALNTDQFTYYAFFARMNEQVRNRWVSNVRNYMTRLTARDQEFLSKQERHTMVEIILGPDGNFLSSILQQSSGDRELDQTTIDAFRAAAPFPNPPHGMIESDGNIHLRYGFVVHFRPPGLSPG